METGPCTKDTGDTQYIGIFPQKHIPLRPQWITVAPKFIETQEVK